MARRAWEIAMLLLAVGSLVLIGWVEVTELGWSDARFHQLALIDLGIVAIFASDLFVRLHRADDRWAFIRAHWYELVGLIPLYVESLSWLRGMRLLRVFRLFRIVQLERPTRRIRAFVRRSRLGHTVALASVVVVLMALSVWVIERDVNPRFATFSDALWWAVVTATTVGYGDITPQTGAGRLLAGILMVGGIGLIATLASTLSLALLGDQPPASLPSDLERLDALHRRGSLTDAEFTAAKKKLLGDLDH